MPSPAQDPIHPTTDPATAGIEIVAEVTISTASALVTHPDNPYLILVADSDKHPRPVIPGGKLELDDKQIEGEPPGLSCISREGPEEIKAPLINLRYVGTATDPERDVRVVPIAKVETALTDPPLSSFDLTANEADKARVRAHYGAPDYLYVCTVDPNAIKGTEELKGHRFIDVRTLEVGDLSVGHDIIAIAYRKMLESGADALDASLLHNFRESSARLIAEG